MNLQEKINADLKAAMIGGFTDRKDLLRVLIGEFNRIGKSLSDQEVVSIIKKMVENAKEMNNKFEIDVLSEYLPQMLTTDQLKVVIEDIIKTNNFNSIKSMGAVMNELKVKYPSKYDGKIASELIKELLK